MNLNHELLYLFIRNKVIFYKFDFFPSNWAKMAALPSSAKFLHLKTIICTAAFPSSSTPMRSIVPHPASCLPLLLLILTVSFPSPSLSDDVSPIPPPSPPAPPPLPTEQDLLLNIHSLENQLRSQRQALATLQDARARSDRSADAAATTRQNKKDSDQVCATEDGNGQNGECASPDEQFKLVGSRVLGYGAKAGTWLPWAVSHASLYICIAGDDGALHIYSRTGMFKASYSLPPNCQPTSIDVSGFKTDVVVFLAVGCADASLAIVSISGPPYRAQARFSPGTSAAFAAADVNKLPSDTWHPTLSLVNVIPPLTLSNPPPPPLIIADDFYPAPPPSPPDSIQHVVAVHRQRIPSFVYVTAGGRVLLASRNGTLVSAGRVTESHLPVAAARYLTHSFILLATQQGAVIWDFRLMSIVSACTETVTEIVAATRSEKHTDFEHRQETRTVRLPFTRPLISAAQEATASDSRLVHVLDSRASIITLSIKADRSRVKCHALHEIPGALPSPPPLPALTGLRGGFAAASATHINIFRCAAEGAGSEGAALEIQMPVRTSPSSTTSAPPSASPLTVADGAYVLAVVAADGTLTMYQVRGKRAFDVQQHSNAREEKFRAELCPVSALLLPRCRFLTPLSELHDAASGQRRCIIWVRSLFLEHDFLCCTNTPPPPSPHTHTHVGGVTRPMQPLPLTMPRCARRWFWGVRVCSCT
jgi:hypothetical protein